MENPFKGTEKEYVHEGIKYIPFPLDEIPCPVYVEWDLKSEHPVMALKIKKIGMYQNVQISHRAKQFFFLNM